MFETQTSCLVVTPTYNEAKTISPLVKTILSLGQRFSVLVVDDSSPDGTGGLVKRLTIDYPGRVSLLTKDKKSGLGAAYRSGFRWALERNYDYIFEMDADFSHSPKDLLRLLGAVKGADVIIGSRYLKGGGFQGWPWYRILISRVANIVARFVAQIPINDLTAGFVCYRREVLEKLDLNSIKSDGYGFQIEMKVYCSKRGFRLKEVPIVFTKRKEGKSKMNLSIILETACLLARLEIHRLLGFD